MADSDGSNSIQLTSFGGPTTGTPRWSPDSRRIVFDSRASGHADLYTVNADGGPPQRLATGTPDASVPSWSGDGRWIYFSVTNHGIWKVPAEGGKAVQLTNDGILPQESGDGTRIFYVNSLNRLKSASVNGGDERDVQGINSAASSFVMDRWTPSRNGLYFIDDSSIPDTLRLLNTTTGKSQVVTKVPGRIGDWGTGLSVSADGRVLVFAVNDEMNGDIMLVEGFR